MKFHLFSKLIFLVLCFAFTNNGFSQNQNSKKFIQFVFTNLETKADAVKIDNFVRLQTGVVISRADVPSKKYLLIYDSNSGIDITLVSSWMNQLGYTYKCIREGIHGVDAIIDQNINCDQ